eukprot:550100-Rhodomonas_salina.3
MPVTVACVQVEGQWRWTEWKGYVTPCFCVLTFVPVRPKALISAPSSHSNGVRTLPLFPPPVSWEKRTLLPYNCLGQTERLFVLGGGGRGSVSRGGAEVSTAGSAKRLQGKRR